MSRLFRFLAVLIVIGVGGVFLYPTIQWYFFATEEDKQIASQSRVEVRDYASVKARGDVAELRSLAQADTPIADRLEYLIPLARDAYRLDERDLPDEWTVTTILAAFVDETDLITASEGYYRDLVTRLKTIKTRIILPGLDLSGGITVLLEANRESLAKRLGTEPTDDQYRESIDLALEILQTRIDRFGITEPQIRRIDDSRISIELPGDDDPERVNAFLLGKGSLNFHIVDDALTQQFIDFQAREPTWNAEIDDPPEFMRAGTKAVEYVTRDSYGIDQYIRHIVINEDVRDNGLSGSYLIEAEYTRDPLTTRPTVNFVLDGEGATIFAKLTRDNVGNSLAIVQDGVVRAYATLQEEIASGQARLRGFSEEEARNIARVLRTAALPIDLDVINQQQIGAQLGAATVDASLRAVALGFVLVAVFMLFYYRWAGLLADLMLILNLYLIISVLSVFNLTLTLTSIAGIILTVGMAVDANVIIFERIKEEYRLGKSPSASVSAGFRKAFWTITDANVTTFIAAIFLSQFGSGPIQGFAVTLAVGIVFSMFTALFVARLLFDFSLQTLKVSRLRIGWGMK